MAHSKQWSDCAGKAAFHTALNSSRSTTKMATSYPLPRRHPTAIASYRVFYELAERSPILTPYDGEDSVVASCIVAMRKVDHIVDTHVHAL